MRRPVFALEIGRNPLPYKAFNHLMRNKEITMGDMGDYWREAREDKKWLREKLGVECPRCKEVRPRAHASILLPQQRCRVDGYRDPRPYGGEEKS